MCGSVRVWECACAGVCVFVSMGVSVCECVWEGGCHSGRPIGKEVKVKRERERGRDGKLKT